MASLATMGPVGQIPVPTGVTTWVTTSMTTTSS
jgi:hypothetical protein